MHIFLALLFFFAPPFWESRQPPQWSDRQVEELLTNSPWAQRVGPDPAIQVFLATAQPIEQAEAEARIRGKEGSPEPDPDYTEYASRNRDSQLVLAIDYRNCASQWPEQENRRMQEESIMVVGRKKHHMVGYFPPTPPDPVLRIVFPRDLRTSDKRVNFQLYLPGITFPDRELEFEVKDLMYRGKLEF